VSWKSTKEPIVALSSCEAEIYSSITSCVPGCLTQNDVEGVKDRTCSATKASCGQQCAIDLAKHPTSHGRRKHNETKFHFLHEQVNNEKFDVEYYKSELQLAYVFTKALKAERLKIMRDSIGVFWILA